MEACSLPTLRQVERMIAVFRGPILSDYQRVNPPDRTSKKASVNVISCLRIVEGKQIL